MKEVKKFDDQQKIRKNGILDTMNQTYNLMLLCNSLLFHELSFFLVVGACTDKGNDGDCKKNCETFNPGVTKIFFRGG